MKILHKFSQLCSLRMCGVSVLSKVSKFWKDPTTITPISRYYLPNNLLAKSIQRKWIRESNNILMKRISVIKLVKIPETMFPNPSITWTPLNTSSLAHLSLHPKKREKEKTSGYVFLVLYFIFLFKYWFEQINIFFLPNGLERWTNQMELNNSFSNPWSMEKHSFI